MANNGQKDQIRDNAPTGNRKPIDFDIEKDEGRRRTRVSGKGCGRKSHYEAFEYDGLRYDLEDPAEKKRGGNWQSCDSRELFYSFHRDDVPAKSVLHKCVVHFIPLNKQIPNRKQHPGFIVQKVYDTEQKRLFRLTDKDYEDNKQHEIDLLVQKTLSRLGDLPDIEIEDTPVDQEDQLKNKRLLRKKSMSLLDVSRDDEAMTKSGQSLKAETPGSVTSNASEYYTILSNFKTLTGETQRDKWLEKLLQGIQFVCSPVDNGQSDDKEKGGSHGIDQARDRGSKSANGSQEKNDFQKYNQKIRQLVFNLKSNSLLARRLLNGELEPSKILNMSPNKLKEGLTAEEIANKEPEESERMQMTDTRCKRCSEKKASTLTIDRPSSARSIGTAPWATAKFEDVEKK
ncbi:hypothetical protein TEA_012550 [Camellia sinensis var. sinensis]|uniref:TFIIS central domain-containing protein n=1 Tax=Camellia sinensis var. sinensis TaxID=542762 RepID=A0A4S4E8V2_CAMSN|nr:hypothetical protein TEA_012550 [Camellia sinensis var. sinensis]